MAFCIEPHLIVLDEPTSAVDPEAREAINGHFTDYNKRTGVPFIFSTHNLHEAEVLSNNLIVVSQGSILFKGLNNDFKKLFS